MYVFGTRLLPRQVCLARLKWPAAAVIAVVGSYYCIDSAVYDNLENAVLKALDSTGSKSDENSKAISSLLSGLFGRFRKGEDPSLPPDVMNELIRKHEFAKEIHRGIVSRFETNSYAANNPIEDRHAECYLKNGDAQFYGIFDGHSGYHCSETVKSRLPIYMNVALGLINDNTISTDGGVLGKDVEILGKVYADLPLVTLPSNFAEKQRRLGSGEDAFAKYISSHSFEAVKIDELIKFVFKALDQDICNESIPDGVADESLLTGISGSCAVTAVIKEEDLYVGNAGDCRAVLGKINSNGSWSAIQLTEDQDAENNDEVLRLYKAHPDEKPTVITNGRLLGQLQPLRAFGDVQYKWDKLLHESVLNVVYGRPVVPTKSYKTPPYLTAEPVVTHKSICAEDRFLILATDGLWERVGNEKAVKIVGEYLGQIRKGENPEENGATKLIRFALGKGSNVALANMLRLPDNFKRHFHDDITVTIVYFESDKTTSKL